jgi:hypothetical protein
VSLDEPFRTVKRFGDVDDNDAPKAVITRVGRWTYRIVIHHDITEYGPGTAGIVVGWSGYGRRHAAWKARGELRRYLSRPERWSAPL